MADIEMPQLGETVTEGTVTKWFKAVGDPVAEDEVLFEVSTDKVDSEVPSPVAGYLAEIKVPEGDTVDVGTVLAVVTDVPPSGGAAAAPAAEPAPEPEPEPAPVLPPPPPPSVAPAAAPPPPPAAPAPPAPAAPAPAPAAAPVVPGTGEGKVLSPVVRRLINEHGLDADTIRGTGVGGRVTRSDVQRVIEAGPPATPAPGAPVTSRPAGPAPRSGSGDTVEKLNKIRRMTGEHMVRSKATSPHAMTAVEVDFEAVERVRTAHRDQFKATEGFSLTYLPFISRAVVDALRDFPHLNATVGDGELVVHNYVNLAIAVDLDFEGLLAPVIHDADDKRLRAVAREIHDLATRARTKKLSADEVTGGTFTLSNSGPFGTFMVIPVINQPQVAILSTDGVSRKPVVVTAPDGSEAIAIHSVGMLAMSWDHRAFDGAYAAAFLREVKSIIETRDWEAEIS
jgi:pyruvate dehydrogenase E2 component (dihydrolipoamide acetyltransferase)